MKTHLCVAAERIDNIQSLSRHGGIEAALQVAQVLVGDGDLAFADERLLDAIGQRLVGRLPTPQLGEVVRLLLLVMLLVDLGLRHGHRVVRAGRHHGACRGGSRLGTATLGEDGRRCGPMLVLPFTQVWRLLDGARSSGQKLHQQARAAWRRGPGGTEYSKKRSVPESSTAQRNRKRRDEAKNHHVPMPPRRGGTCCPAALGGTGCGA